MSYSTLKRVLIFSCLIFVLNSLFSQEFSRKSFSEESREQILSNETVLSIETTNSGNIVGISDLSFATGYCSENIALGSDGGLHVVWSSSWPGEFVVFYSQSKTNGGTWSDPVVINDGYYGYKPCITVDPNNPDILWVGYVGHQNEGEDRSVRVIKSTNGGQTWGASVPVFGSIDKSCNNPDMAVDSQGNIHIVFDDYNDYQIYYNYSGDGGETWLTEPELLDMGGFLSCYTPTISIDSNDCPHTLFGASENNSGYDNASCHWNWRDMTLGTWQQTPSLKITPDAYGEGNASHTLIFDLEGTGHLWYDGSNSLGNAWTIYYRTLDNYQWSDDVDFVQSDAQWGSTHYPSAAIDNQNHLYLSYFDTPNMDDPLRGTNVFAATNRSGQWEFNQIVDEGNAFNNQFLDAARNVINGKFHMLYTSGDHEPYSIVHETAYFGEVISAQGKQIFINEFLASNTTINPDNHDFDDYSDWLEIYNAEVQPVDVGGCFITDNLNNPTKWQIPEGTTINAKGFIHFWADGYDEVPGKSYTRPDGNEDDFITQYFHLNFKLSRAGEEIGIFSPDTVLIDSVTFGIQMTDISYGRKPDGGSSWLYFGEPTPKNSNDTPGTLNTEHASVPVFSTPGGFYSNGQTVSLSTGSPSAVIKYTTDGSRPGSSSREFDPEGDPDIILNITTVIRSRVFDGDKLPGPIVTQTYMIDENITLPVISIAAYPQTMFGNEIGIYWNMLKSREIPISFEFFESDGTPGFNVDAGLRLTGQASFRYPQKPFTIYMRDRFGAEEINYQIFKNRDINRFTNIYLRNSGSSDNRHTLFRDALQHSLVINQMDLDCQAYRPAKTFINGEYWGIYNLREKLNTEYIASHHNVDPNNLDYLEFDFDNTPVVIEGDPANYYTLVDFMDNNDITLSENYNYVASQIDINEFINYQITEIFCDNINWPYTNMRWWREKTSNGKWRWILLDMDFGFGFTKDGGTYDFSSFYTNNTFDLAVSAPGSHSDGYESSTFVFRTLIENDTFRNEFIQRFAGYLNTTFHADRVLHIVDSLKTQIYTEMPLHIDRWNDDDSDYLVNDDPPIPDMAAWETSVEYMREFAINRTSHQRQHIIDFFGLSGTAELTLNIPNSDHGRVYISNIEMEDGYSGPYYKDVPIQLQAFPKVRYRFVRWQGLSSSTSDSISVVLTANATITAVFEATSESLLPLNISADLELTTANSPYLASGDVTVDAGVELRVQPGVEIRMPVGGSIYVNGNVMMNGSEANPILIGPNTNAGANQWGALCLTNATDSSSISYVQITGATEGADHDNQMGAISAYNSTISIDNVTIEDAPFPIFVQYGRAYIHNCTLHSDKICDLINIKYADYALVENCDLRGNISYDTDAVDYDQIENGIIRGNRIYNFYGVNSDGIDLGEKSTNILIENNLIFNITDKGISIGQESTANVMGNVIVNCAQGVGIKDEGSYASIDGNTFYGNDFSIASFEKNIGVGGGSADAVNNIFTNSIRSTFFLDDLSTLDITYSLSDTDSLSGTGNVYADPLMGRNFRLLSSSPAINAGSPGSSVDPDGSTRDLGAYYYDESENVYVIINEIHYNPADGENSEFIELYNTGNSQIDLGGYNFTKGIDYIFPAGSSINAGEYIIVAKNEGSYSGQGFQVFQWADGTLSNIWDHIQLEDDQGQLIDYVNYSNEDGWVSSPDGMGPSLELRSPSLENLYYGNWRASLNQGGTPGAVNAESLIAHLYINEFMAVNAITIKDDNDEYDDWIELYNNSDSPINVGGLYITDDLSNPDKYQIPMTEPDSTTIQPHGYLLLWADENRNEGILHCNFQLDGNGEAVGLVQKIDDNFVFIDQIEFNAQSADVSYGRSEDGGDDWQYMSLPTPNIQNVRADRFEGGILLVNGVSFYYGDEIIDAYENHVFWGDSTISFWDCFETVPEGGYPSTLPEPLGRGVIPDYIMNQFSTVIWVGNGYQGDLEIWEETNVLHYLESGGNLLLMTRRGNDFINGDIRRYLGIQWEEEAYIEIQDCIAVYPGLVDIGLTGSQTNNSVFNININKAGCELLFKETSSFGVDRGLGVWYRPESGGTFRSDGGQIVFLSGRPYRYNHEQLRSNVEYILGNLLVSTTSVKKEEDAIISKFTLLQNYPNPFNPETEIRYQLPLPALVTVTIYNLQGHAIRVIANDQQEAGSFTKMWDGKDARGNYVASGVYFYRINAESGKQRFIQTRKMILLR